MGTARLIESFWTCTKRWKLERFLEQRGHRWPKASQTRYAPLCAAECVARALAWIDTLDDPQGRLPVGDPASDLELAAGWEGKPGLLWEAFVATGWVVDRAGRWQWNDYAAVNGLAIQARIRKRRERDGLRDEPRDEVRDEVRDQPRDRVRDEVRDQPRDRVRDGVRDQPRDGPRDQLRDEPRDLSGPESVVRSPGTSPGPGDPPVVPPRGDPAPAAPERAAAAPRRAASPAEALARRLATRLGSGLRPCQAQVRALRAEGWSLERIDAAIADHAAAGLAPWDWTRLAKGTAAPPRHGGLTGEQIRRMTERPADPDALALGAGGAP